MNYVITLIVVHLLFTDYTSIFPSISFVFSFNLLLYISLIHYCVISVNILSALHMALLYHYMYVHCTVLCAMLSSVTFYILFCKAHLYPSTKLCCHIYNHALLIVLSHIQSCIAHCVVIHALYKFLYTTLLLYTISLLSLSG